MTVPTHTVYVLRDAGERVVYVGVTNDFDRRWREHNRSGRFGGTVMAKVVTYYDRRLAEVIEARMIRALRPAMNVSSGSKQPAPSKPLDATGALFAAFMNDALDVVARIAS